MADIRIIPSAGAINVTGSADFRGTGGSSILFLTGSGQIGVGTTNPESEFHIVSSGTRFVTLDRSGTRSYDLGVNSAGTMLVTDNTVSADRISLSHSGSVGIGTTAPLSLLHLRGPEPAIRIVDTDDSSTAIIGSTAGYTFIRPFSRDFRVINDAGVGLLTVKTGGSIGIGTTGPTKILHVVGEVRFSSYGAGTVTGTAARSLAVDSSGNIIEVSNSSLAGSGTANRVAYWTDSNTIAADADFFFDGTNVGIGTTAPDTRLHVWNGNSGGAPYEPTGITIEHSGRASLNFLSGAGNDAYVFFGNSSAGNAGYVGYENTANRLVLRSSDFISLIDSTGEVIRIDGGNVGIGTTSPSYKLHVSGGSEYIEGGFGGNTATAYTATNRLIFNNDYSDTARGPNKITLYDSSWLGGFGVHSDTLGYYSGGTHKWYQATDATNAVHLMTLNSSGNLGIGYTSANQRLVVAGNIAVSSSNTEGAIWLGDGQSIGLSRSNSYDLVLAQEASSGNPLYLAGAGDVIVSIDSNNNETTRKFIVGSNAVKASNELFSVNESGNVYVGNDLNVDGKITAREFHTSFVSASIIFQSGSTQFGNSSDDTHVFTGNVGIGTSAPQKALEVIVGANNVASVGVAQMSPGDFTGIHFGYRENNQLYRKSAIVFQRTDLTANNAQGKVHILNGPQGNANSATLADAKITIAEDGNVGIGVTSPTNLLHLAGASATPSLRLGSVSTGYHYDLGRENLTTGDFMINATVNGVSQGSYLRMLQSTGAATFISSVTAVSALLQSANTNSVVDIFTLYNPSQTSSGVRQKFANGYGDLASIKVSQIDNGAGADNGQIEFQTATDAALSTKLTILDTGAATFASSVTAGSFVKTSGTSAQFLKADGSVDSSTYLTSFTEADTLQSVTTRGSATTTGMTIAGDVGIGTTAPSRRLTVSQGTGTNTNSYMSFNNSAERWVIGNEGGFGGGTSNDFIIYDTAYRLVVKAGGNVGIGTTVPVSKFHVQGNVSIGTFNDPPTGNHSQLEVRGPAGESGFAVIKSFNAMKLGVNSGAEYGGQAQFWIGRYQENGSNARTALTVSLGHGEIDNSSNADVDVMTMLSNGNVGIGTNAPKVTLDVAGAGGKVGITNTGTTGYSEVIFYEGSTVKADIWVNGSTQTDYAGANSMNIWQGSNAPMAFYTNGTNERMRITSAGNVGIGITNPSAKFYVNNSGGTGNPFYVDLGNPGGATTLFEHTGASTPVPFRVRKSGFAGASPNYGLLYLHMNDSTISNGSNLYFTLNDSAGNEHEYAGLGGTIRSNTNGAETGDLFFMTSDAGATRSEKMRIISNGNVGIGTDNPTAKLHVQGSNLMVTFKNSSTSADQYSQLEFIAGSRSAYIWLGNQATTSWAGDGGLNIYTHTGHMDFWTAATQRMRLQAGGNLGIGTLNPGYKLQVDGTVAGFLAIGAGDDVRTGLAHYDTTAQATGVGGQLVLGYKYTDAGDFTEGAIIKMYKENSASGQFGSGLKFQVRNHGVNLSTKVVIDPSGNVGIGTTAPRASLDVAGGITIRNTRVSTAEKYPLGHYTPGETVFEIDPTWTEAQLQDYFNSTGVSWTADSTSPGGYAIQIDGEVNVGGEYNTGFPYIPVDSSQDDWFYMECWIRNEAGSVNNHYMGGIDYNESFVSLGGNPGSFTYNVMQNYSPGTSWTKVFGYWNGFGNSAGGAGTGNANNWESGTKYFTPQALFNYSNSSGTRRSYISGWKCVRVRATGNRYYSDNVLVGGSVGIGTTSPTDKLHVYSSATTGAIRVGGGNGTSNSRIFIEAAGNNSYIDSFGDSTYKPLAIEASVIKLNASSIGNVGIGIGAPTAKLHIVNPDAGNDGLIFQKWAYTTGTTGVYELALKQTVTSSVVRYNFSMINASTAYDNVLVLDRGNVGIGTTNPSFPLHVVGYARANGFSVNDSSGTPSAFIGYEKNWIGSGTSATLAIAAESQKINFYAGGSTDIRMMVSSSGNVGIGTSVSNQKLHVYGSNPRALIQDSSTGYPILQLDNDSNGSFYIAVDNSAGTGFGSAYGRYIYSEGTYPMILVTDSVERIRITAGGNIGIGNQTSPNGYLAFPDDTQTRKIVLWDGSANNNFQFYGVGVESSTFLHSIYDVADRYLWTAGVNSGARSEIMVLQGNGNLGIGNTAPNQKLELSVGSGVTGGLRINYAASATGEGMDITYLNNGATTTSFDSRYNSDSAVMQFRMKTAATAVNAMTILGNGNIGIGTTSPTAKVNVLIGAGGANGTVGLKIGGTGNYDSLELGIEGNYDGQIRTYGNDLHLYAGHWRTVGSTATEDHAIRFFTSKTSSTNWSTAKMILTADGNVGIGSNSPSRKLDVVGNARIGDNTSQQAHAALQVSAGQGSVTTFRDIDMCGSWAAGEGHAITANYSTNANNIVGQIVFEHNDPGSRIKFGRLYHSGDQSTYPFHMVSTGSAGRLGIGTSVPTAPLDTLGVRVGRDFSIANRATVRLDSNGDGNPADVLFGHTAAANQSSWDGVYWSVSSRGSGEGNKFYIYRAGGNPGGSGEEVILALQPNGNIGIGSTAPAFKLDVSGAIRATGDVLAFSDARVKENIVTLENSLDLVQKLRGVRYNRIGESDNKIGVIAQEVLEVLPEVVQQDQEGTYSVAYGNITALLIEAIKQQQLQIDELKLEIKQLKG